jgi:chloramphenicol 3-O phosphotransferase
VLLNGVGSVGKSSIAKALQRIVSRPMVHVQMDAFLEMLPPGTFGDPAFYRFETTFEGEHPVTAVEAGPMMRRLMGGMRRAIAALAADGLDVVVDDVFWGEELADYRALLSPFDFYAVSLIAPLAVLEERERARGDRDLGLARWQFGRVAAGPAFDLTIDTSRATPDECASWIKRTFGL